MAQECVPVSRTKGAIASQASKYGSITPGDQQTAVRSYFGREMMDEAIGLVRFAVPVAIAASCRNLLNIIDTMYVGELGVTEIAGFGMAINLMGMLRPIYICPANAILPTLIGRAIGSGNSKQAGDWVQLNLCYTLVMLIPVCIFLYYGTFRFYVSVFGADLDAAASAQTYMRVYLLVIPIAAVNAVLRSYASAINETTGPMVAAGCAVGLNVIFNQVLVLGIPGHFEGLGYIGSPLATALALFTQTLIFVAFSFWWKQAHLKADAWSGPSCAALGWQRVKHFTQLSIPVTAGVLTQKVGMVSLTMLATSMGKETSACLSVLFSLEILFCALCEGFGTAIQVRLSTHLGAADAHCAKIVLITSYVTMGIISSSTCTFMYYNRYALAAMYSRDLGFREMLVSGFPALVSGVFLMGFSSVSSSSLYAMGRAPEVAAVQWIAVWLILLPVGVRLIFFQGDTSDAYNGVLWACAASYLVENLLSGTLLIQTNWEAQVARARKKIH